MTMKKKKKLFGHIY